MPTGNREMEALSPKSLVFNNIYNIWPLFIQKLLQWILFWVYNNTADLFSISYKYVKQIFEKNVIFCFSTVYI